MPPTDRNSPPNPTSPTATTSAGTATLVADDTIANANPRSAPGSVTRAPPTAMA